MKGRSTQSRSISSIRIVLLFSVATAVLSLYLAILHMASLPCECAEYRRRRLANSKLTPYVSSHRRLCWWPRWLTCYRDQDSGRKKVAKPKKPWKPALPGHLIGEVLTYAFYDHDAKNLAKGTDLEPYTKVKGFTRPDADLKVSGIKIDGYFKGGDYISNKVEPDDLKFNGLYYRNNTGHPKDLWHVGAAYTHDTYPERTIYVADGSCLHCKGTGEDQDRIYRRRKPPCDKCNGTGNAEVWKMMKLHNGRNKRFAQKPRFLAPSVANTDTPPTKGWRVNYRYMGDDPLVSKRAWFTKRVKGMSCLPYRGKVIV